MRLLGLLPKKCVLVILEQKKTFQDIQKQGQKPIPTRVVGTRTEDRTSTRQRVRPEPPQAAMDVRAAWCACDALSGPYNECLGNALSARYYDVQAGLRIVHVIPTIWVLR